jgi:uncharacterized protein YcaQ
VLEVARDLGCVQLDPISAVDRSHRLVWRSRLGSYETAHLDQVIWQERHLFEYWAHQASLVLTEDYPLHHLMMRGYPGRSAWSDRTRAWIQQNDRLRRYILREIKRHGPVASRQLEEDGLDPNEWVSTGWTSGRNVSRMLDFLWLQGKILVAGRAGGQKLWDLSERVLPAWTPRERLSEREVTRRAAERSLRALGVATPLQIGRHFLRGRYTDLPRALAELEKQGRVARVQLRDGAEAPWRGEWYIHTADQALLDSLADDTWPAQARTTLLSPFDNLICDRARTEQLFDFHFRIEIYVPQSQRKFGYYVLPILHGDRLIGRVDPLMDRAARRLRVNAVYAELGAPVAAGTGQAVRAAIEELAVFLGATAIDYEVRRLPRGWKVLKCYFPAGARGPGAAPRGARPRADRLSGHPRNLEPAERAPAAGASRAGAGRLYRPGPRGGAAPFQHRRAAAVLRYVLPAAREPDHAGRCGGLVGHHEPLHPQPDVAAAAGRRHPAGYLGHARQDRL